MLVTINIWGGLETIVGHVLEGQKKTPIKIRRTLQVISAVHTDLDIQRILPNQRTYSFSLHSVHSEPFMGYNGGTTDCHALLDQQVCPIVRTCVLHELHQ